MPLESSLNINTSEVSLLILRQMLLRNKMLWSPAVLLLLAGAALASPQTGYEDGKEYIYKIRSRTIAEFDRESKQYSGILIEARLTLQPNGPETFRAKISQPRYAQIHTRLEHGWDSEIPQNQKSLQSLPLSNEPIEIRTKNGAVHELIVDKNIPTWEVNIIKGIVSQLQVDLRGENSRRSKHDQLPEGDQPTALFKTMEDTVGGKCEVLYDVSLLPESMRQNEPELAPMPELRDDGELINVVKTKNYSNCEQRMSYHFGIDGSNKEVPDKNENGRYLSRSSVSRIVLSGKPKKFIIQSSVTTNKVVHIAGAEDHQEGMVVSKMNLTLNEVKEASERLPPPSDPQSAGNLVYNFNDPMSEKSRHPTQNSDSRKSKSRKSQDSMESNESSSASSESSESQEEREDASQYQPQPKLTEAPKIPLLPLFIGNRGKSIQKSDKVDVTSRAKELAKQIGDEMQKPDSMAEEKTLEKFILLTRIIRTMDAEQVEKAQRELYEPRESPNQVNPNKRGQNARRTTWVAFRDAMAQSGTGPALVNIKQLVQNKKIKGDEAAAVIDATAKSARAPTPEYLDAFFKMATMEETKEEEGLRESAIMSFANLLRHAVVNKRTAHNRYPVHTFGKFAQRDHKDLHEKYIPHIAEELKKAVDSGNSERVAAYAVALGKTGHPRILSVLEPYLEGRKQVSPFQRLVMVLSLGGLSEVKPRLARGILYKIYANHADHHEIRTAAVYMLMGTQPPASMLQRMAEMTNYDSNKQVNSAVKSSIESLAKLKGEENRNLVNAAKSAKPLLTSEVYGPQQSRSLIMNLEDPLGDSGVSILANYIGSDDSIIPKGLYISSKPTQSGLKEKRSDFGIAVSSVKDLMNFVHKKLKGNKDNDQENNEQQKRDAPENLARMLGINGDEPKQIEGLLTMNGKYGDKMTTFDNHTLDKLSKELKQLAEDMKSGKSFDHTKLNNREMTISFPTETGLPLYFAVDVPTVMSITGRSKLTTDSEENKDTSLPKSATVSGSIRVVYGIEVQKRMGFVVPFESQEYVSGLNKNLQINLPLRAEISYDKSKREVRVKIQPNSEDEGNKLVQYKEKPFTSKHDIMNLEPLSKDKNTHPIKKDETKDSEVEFNDENGKQTVKIQMSQAEIPSKDDDKKDGKQEKALRALRKIAESVSSLYSTQSRRAEYRKYDVKVNPKSDASVEIKLTHDSKRKESEDSSEDSEDESPKAKAPTFENDLNNKDRKQKLLDEAMKNIKSARADAVDISIKVNGGSESSVKITAAIGKSNIDKKSRALLYVSTKGRNGQNYLSAGVAMKTHKSESIDYEETLKENKPREIDAEIRVGKGQDENDETKETKFKIRGRAQQTESRKNEVRQSPEAQECNKHKEKTGDKTTSACEKANQKANTLNFGELTITSQDEKNLQDVALNLLDAVESLSKDYAETSKTRMDKEEKNKIKVTFEMSPSNEKVDISLKSPAGKLEVKNAKLTPNSRENNGEMRDMRNKKNQGLSGEQDNECFLDKTLVKTFDNHRYQVKLGKCYHVAMTSYPKNDPESPTQKQNIPKDSRVSVLAKETEGGKKVLKVTLGEKEIKLTPSDTHRAEVTIDDKKVDLSKKRSYQEKQEEKVLFEVLKQEDRSIKIISDKYDIKIVYDGSRAKLEAGDRYRSSVRGLCGNKDGEPEDDQQTPKGCLLQRPEEFAATYALTSDEKCEGPARQNAEKARKSKCSPRMIKPGNVISEKEAGRKSDDKDSREDDEDQEKRCTRHRTMVKKSTDEICFSLRPVPKCSSKCSPSSTKPKNIQFYCVSRSSASEKIAERVENGANPDLSQKKVSKTENLEVPVSCKP